MKHVTQVELDDFAQIEDRITYQPSDAFSTIETVGDLRDVIELFLSGYNVGCQPIAGTLAGMMRPTRVEVLQGFPEPVEMSAVTRLKSGGGKPQTYRNEWNVKARDTPKSLAKAFADIVECAACKMTLCVDLTAISDPKRAKVVAEAFIGFCGLLNHRAHRILSQADIADLLEWTFIASDIGSLDIQTVYGAPSYGAVLRRECDTMDVTPHRPAKTRATRSLVAYVLPQRADLDAIFIHAAKTGKTVGLINGERAASRLQGFRGSSPDKGALLPNHGTILNSNVDLDGLDECDQWKTVKLAARSRMRDTEARLPDGLQPEWQAQADYRRLIGLSVSGVEPTRDHRNHALYDAIKEADAMTVCQPKLVTILRSCAEEGSVFSLHMQQDGLVYADHNVALDVPFDAMEVPRIVDWLTAHWRDFVAANFVGP
jgi:hypothetical protein